VTKIFLENFPWLPIIQPYEDYGLQKYVESTPTDLPCGLPRSKIKLDEFDLWYAPRGRQHGYRPHVADVFDGEPSA